MPPVETQSRKDDHIRINLDEDVSFATTTTGLERLRLVHQAVPELDLADVDTSTAFLGHSLSMPLVIASMTGGTPLAGKINRMLAEAAQVNGIGMGLGSGRAILEDLSVAKSYQVRSYAPDIPLFANLGAVQLNYGYGPADCQRLIDVTQADGLYLHLNPLQEALQPEGDSRFSGLLQRIEALCGALSVPVLAKEVGWGLSRRAARQLIACGVAALDVAGAGGTSWSQVEYYRQGTNVGRELAVSFRDWGIPTADAIAHVREVSGSIPLVASGGLGTGIDIAKCVALGADIASMAGLILRAAAESSDALQQRLDVIRRQLTVAMFAAGCANLADLNQAELAST